MKNKMMERKFFGSVIRQRIDNEMLSISDLSIIYEDMRVENNWSEKPVHKFFESKNSGNYEFLIELVREGNIIKGEISPFIETAEKIGILKALKQFGLYKMVGKGIDRSVFCHPYIFVAIAMWMNPSFKAKAIIWITDELIINRLEAGERYNVLSSAISSHIVPTMDSDNGKKFIYSNFAKLINKKVFGEHADNLRQIASRDDLKQLTRLQDKLSTLIEVGYISTYQEAKTYISTI